MSRFNFENQTVVVTGAAGALGSTTAELFFRAGANLALVDISFAKLTHPRWKHAKNVGLFVTDLTDVNSVNNSVAQIIESFGKIDCLANVAGGFKMGPQVT